MFILSAALFGVSEILELKGRDPDAPEIVSDREVLEIPCAYTMEQLMEGVSASDEQDGDLTDQIVAGAFSRFTEPGVADLTYVVFDSAGQSASLTREVRFTDYHGPRFTLTEPLVFAEGEGSYTEAMAWLGAEDQLDGSRTEWIVQTDTDVNYSSVGNLHRICGGHQQFRRHRLGGPAGPCGECPEQECADRADGRDRVSDRRGGHRPGLLRGGCDGHGGERAGSGDVFPSSRAWT